MFILNLKIKPLKIDPNAPPDQIAEVICICGSTEAGRGDDIFNWKELCKKNNIYLYIDTEYSDYYRYCKDSKYQTENTKAMLNNLHLQDSLAIDPHKLGYTPYPGAIFFLEDKNDVMFINSTKEVRYLGIQKFFHIILKIARLDQKHHSIMVKKLMSQYKKVMVNNWIGIDLHNKKIISINNFEIYWNKGLGLFIFRDTKLNEFISFWEKYLEL